MYTPRTHDLKAEFEAIIVDIHIELLRPELEAAIEASGSKRMSEWLGITPLAQAAEATQEQAI